MLFKVQFTKYNDECCPKVEIKPMSEQSLVKAGGFLPELTRRAQNRSTTSIYYIFTRSSVVRGLQNKDDDFFTVLIDPEMESTITREGSTKDGTARLRLRHLRGRPIASTALPAVSTWYARGHQPPNLSCFDAEGGATLEP